MQQFKLAKLYDADGDLNQRWFIFYYFRSPDSGKFVRFRQWISFRYPTRQTRYEYARGKIREINARLSTGYNPFSAVDRTTTALVDCINKAYESKKKSTRRRTWMTYKSHLKFLRTFLSDHSLTRLQAMDFNSYHCQDFMDWYQGTHNIGNRTYNNMLLSMNAIFNWMKGRGYILINPFSAVERLSPAQPSLISFSDDDRKVIHENLAGYNYDLFVIAQLIFSCYLRPQELVRLKVKHINLKKGIIIVPGEVSKNNHNEVLSIPRSVLAKLDRLDLNYPGEFYLFSTNLKRGKHEIFPQRITEAWNGFADLYHVSRGIYGLKHTGNGLALESGIDIRDIQLHNRHSSLSVTQKYLDRFRNTPSQKLIEEFPEL